MRAACLPLLFFLSTGYAADSDRFVPKHRLTGIGVGRDDLSEDLLEVRTDRMIAAQTFAIMREPQALAGARRITGSAKLQALFRSAELASGFPARVIEAIAYLESWGDSRAESPAGPRGIMQISAATATTMGLKITYATRYRVIRERVAAKDKRGRTVRRTVTRRIPYRVQVRDDRLLPERAIPAAARYLAGMEQKFGGRDWAIFGYHCGQGCIGMLQEITRKSRGIPRERMSVARMFFANSPAWNRELYEALQQQMQRDYSPTYWFRVMRAEQLLALYRRDPAEFAQLAAEYKSQFVSASTRAPHRLSVWLKKEDLVYRSDDDIRAGLGNGLVRALDRPAWFGYTLKLDGDSEYLSEVSPAAAGTLIYVAFETRRLFEEMHPRGTRFEPLTVTSLVQPEDSLRMKGRPEALTHCSGQVFDIDHSVLPPAELECLRFVLSDLGWEGYLGFVEEGMDNLHIGSAPAARDFFTSVFQDAIGRGEG
ncbi:MAG: transglycosylase SLT domain-containing protein [Acidobacteria bacterium]|nr:transglycosylase SLT domain-containing protein [Acidobacteriota bacterium]